MITLSFLRRVARKHFRQAFLFLLVGILFIGMGAAAFKRHNSSSKKINNEDPFLCSDCNVIIIAVDALRPDHLGINGYPRTISPHIDALAQRSLVFDQAITQASWTLPSFLSIFTSLYPTSIHPDTLAVPNDKLPAAKFLVKDYPRLVNIAELFKQNRYITAAFTAGGYLDPSFHWKKGFDSYETFLNFLEKKDTAKELNEKAFDWLDQNKDQKFFLFLYYLDVHCPYVIPGETSDVFASDGKGKIDLKGKCGTQIVRELLTFSEEEQKEMVEQIVDRYDAGIKYVDLHLGKLFEHLKALGLERKTIIVLLADHGEELGDHASSDFHTFLKRTVKMHIGHAASLFNEVLHVPLIVHHPQLKPQRIPYRVRLLDVAPTILDFLGIAVPPVFEGKSLITFLDGREAADRDAFAVSIRSKTVPYGAFAIFSGSLKYIHLHYQNMDNAAKFLYDLQHDPGETLNLAYRFPALTTAMHQTFMDWLMATRMKGEALQHPPHPKLEKPADSTNDRLYEQLKSLGYAQ